ncbi:unnamed protein product [Heligmosomoides polygyrus]|uniref:Protein kinase domain-containing protein n=1 Tax=Heligmosomoides polygyrus TaxID=6339 RepID=A0A183GTF0_HELPZ|nr:unnamed protein product [Heligmosomoides polygyrus]
MSADTRAVIHLFTLMCGPPLDKEPSREEIKLAEWMVSILKDFEARQLEVTGGALHKGQDVDPMSTTTDCGSTGGVGPTVDFS